MTETRKIVTFKTREFPRELLDEAVTAGVLGVDEDGESFDPVVDEYSGRGMFGRTCFALKIRGRGDSATSTVAQLFAVLAAEAFGRDDRVEDTLYGETVADLARAVRSDSLGYDTVVYFPGWTLDADPEWYEHRVEASDG